MGVGLSAFARQLAIRWAKVLGIVFMMAMKPTIACCVPQASTATWNASFQHKSPVEVTSKPKI
jgi:hypothetical protein